MDDQLLNDLRNLIYSDPEFNLFDYLKVQEDKENGMWTEEKEEG